MHQLVESSDQKFFLIVDEYLALRLFEWSYPVVLLDQNCRIAVRALDLSLTEDHI